ncbi:MAG: hypothetical protein KDA76_11655 [Planctomycetaceae bacterium]|nr:hypothetical protein [Planctomycetaceae bacterium]
MQSEDRQHEAQGASNLFPATPSPAMPGTEKGSSAEENNTIAQTAHALLRRWEESRAQTGLNAVRTEAREVRASSLVEPAIIEEMPSASLSLPNDSMSDPTREQAVVKTFTRKIAPPEMSSPEMRELTAEPPTAKGIPSFPRAESVRENFLAESNSESYKDALARTFAAGNDASQLIEKESLATEPAPREIVPRLRESPLAAELPEPSRQSTAYTNVPSENLSSPRGKVKFSPAPERLDDLDIQQAIERHHRKPRNWSAILGQFLAFSGALAMTGGAAIVIANRFGTVEISETTGWLALAGGHLLLVLGIYTHLTSRIEQVWHEMHQRSDEIQKLILQQQAWQHKVQAGSSREYNFSGGTPAETDSHDARAFQRDSLARTV